MSSTLRNLRIGPQCFTDIITLLTFQRQCWQQRRNKFHVVTFFGYWKFYVIADPVFSSAVQSQMTLYMDTLMSHRPVHYVFSYWISYCPFVCLQLETFINSTFNIYIVSIHGKYLKYEPTQSQYMLRTYRLKISTFVTQFGIILKYDIWILPHSRTI